MELEKTFNIWIQTMYFSVCLFVLVNFLLFFSLDVVERLAPQSGGVGGGVRQGFLSLYDHTTLDGKLACATDVILPQIVRLRCRLMVSMR